MRRLRWVVEIMGVGVRGLQCGGGHEEVGMRGWDEGVAMKGLQ